MRYWRCEGCGMGVESSWGIEWWCCVNGMVGGERTPRRSECMKVGEGEAIEWAG